MDTLLRIYVIFRHYMLLWPYLTLPDLVLQGVHKPISCDESKPRVKETLRVMLAKFPKDSALIFILPQDVTAMIAL